MSLAGNVDQLATRLAAEVNALRAVVHAATTVNITLSNTQTVDGVALVAGNFCLVKNQTLDQNNGLYVVVSGGAWTRAVYADTAVEVASLGEVKVRAGTTNGGTKWITSFKSTDTLNTTAMVWEKVATAAGSGIPASTVDAKGDIIVATSNDTVARHAAGADGTIPMYDSTQSDGIANVVVTPEARIFPAKAATTENITLSNTQTVDTVALSAGDFCLVKNQTLSQDNGLYTVVSGGAWTRHSMFDTAAKIAGSIVRVQSGDINGGTEWQTQFKSTDTLNTTTMPWTQINVVRGIPNYTPPTSKGIFDNLRGVYNFKSSNTRILDHGLSQAQYKPGGMSEHLVIGDSVSAGCISSVGTVPTLFDRLQSWPYTFADSLANTGTPRNGNGFMRILDGTVANPFVPHYAQTTGTWSPQAYGASTVALNATVTYSPWIGGNFLDVWYYDSTGGTFTVTIDSTVVKTQGMSGAAGWKKVRCANVNIIGGFSKIVITLTVVGTSGLITSGIKIFTPNAGLIMNNVAQSSSKATGTGVSSWADPASLGLVFKDVAGRKRTITDASCTAGSPTLTSATQAQFTDNDIGEPIDQVVAAGGLMWPPGSYIGARTSATAVTVYNGGGSTPAGPVNALGTLSSQTVTIGRDPTCVHIALGGNDLTAGATDAQITTALTTIRNVFPLSDVILHLTHEFEPGIVTPARSLTHQQAQYRLADALDIPLFDMRDRVGAYSAAQAIGEYGDTAVHLIPQIYANFGASLASAIGNGSNRGQTNGDPIFDLDLVPKQYIDRRKTTTIVGTVTTTTESVVLRLPVPANMFKVGQQIRFQLWCRPAATTITTTRVRIGTTGTTSDASVIVMSATASTNAGARMMHGVTQIQAIGASATHIGGGVENVGAIAAAGTAFAATSSFNSTVNNYITVTVQNTSSTTTTAYAGSLEII